MEAIAEALKDVVMLRFEMLILPFNTPEAVAGTIMTTSSSLSSDESACSSLAFRRDASNLEIPKMCQISGFNIFHDSEKKQINN